MRLWIDVYDEAGVRLGNGAVHSVVNAEVTTVLNGAGVFQATASASDRRAIDLLQVENRVQIWGQRGDQPKRLIAQGIIQNRTLSVADGQQTISINGQDIIGELSRKNTLLARIYNQQALSIVALDLISLVPSWSVVIDPSLNNQVINARFDGVSILSALSALANQYGFHFRLSRTQPKTLEIGKFGDVSGLRVNRVQHLGIEAVHNPKLLMVKQLHVNDTSDELVNWIVPVGAGEGTTALTLEKSDRNSPYAIQTTTASDGSTIYYIADAPSIAQYGVIQSVVQFKEIAPLSNTDTDIKNASNALYDACVVLLERNKQKRVDYEIALPDARQLMVGQKVTVRYRGRLDADDGQPLDFINVNGDFWVIETDQSYNNNDTTTIIRVSNVDALQKDIADVIIGALQNVELRGLKPEITSAIRSYVYARELAPSYPAQIPLEFTDATVELQRLRLRLKTTPFRTTVQGAAAGGNHRHVMFQRTSATGFPTTDNRPYYARNADNDSTPSQASVVLSVFNQGGLFSDLDYRLWTHDASGDHTHPPLFGITDDSVTPANVTVWVNGVNMTSALFGSATLAPSGGNLNVLADMGALTNAIQNRVGGIRQQHIIEVRCAGGRGRIEATLEVFEVTQSIRIV